MRGARWRRGHLKLYLWYPCLAFGITEPTVCLVHVKCSFLKKFYFIISFKYGVHWLDIYLVYKQSL